MDKRSENGIMALIALLGVAGLVLSRTDRKPDSNPPLPDKPQDATLSDGSLDITSWSQHLDKIHWEFIKIFVPSLGALAFRSIVTPGEFWSATSALFISAVGVPYVAAFRAKRNALHRRLDGQPDSDFKTFLRPRTGEWEDRFLPTTWLLFVFTTLWVDLVVVWHWCVWFFTQKAASPTTTLETIWIVVFSLVVVPVLAGAYYAGRAELPGQASGQRD